MMKRERGGTRGQTRQDRTRACLGTRGRTRQDRTRVLKATRGPQKSRQQRSPDGARGRVVSAKRFIVEAVLPIQSEPAKRVGQGAGVFMLQS